MLYVPSNPILNRSHPLFRGLALAIPLFQSSSVSGAVNPHIQDLVNKIKGQPTSGVSWGTGLYGRGAKFPASTADNINLNLNTGIDIFALYAENRRAFTIMALVELNSANTTSRVLFEHKGNGANPSDIYFDLNTAGTNVLEFGFNNFANGFPTTSWTTGWAAGSEHLAFGIWDGTTQRIYADGDPNFKATGTPGSTPGGTWIPQFLNIGNAISSSTRTWDGLIYEILVWNRALTVQERMMLWADPYCLFRPRPFPYANAISGGTLFLQSLSDSITPSESFTKAITKPFTDTVTPAETFIKAITKGAFLETVSITESLAKLIGKNPTDTLTPTDALSKLLSRNAFNESISPTDSLTKQTGKQVSETVTPTESLKKSVTKVFTETVSPTEILSHIATLFKMLTDAVSPTDSLTKATGKSLTETVTPTESFTKQIAKTLTDAAAPVDALVKAVSKSFSETVTIIETFTKSSGNILVKSLSDTVTPTDTLTKLISKRFVDAITPFETFRAYLNNIDVRFLWKKVQTAKLAARGFLKIGTGYLLLSSTGKAILSRTWGAAAKPAAPTWSNQQRAKLPATGFLKSSTGYIKVDSSGDKLILERNWKKQKKSDML